MEMLTFLRENKSSGEGVEGISSVQGHQQMCRGRQGSELPVEKLRCILKCGDVR